MERPYMGETEKDILKRYHNPKLKKNAEQTAGGQLRVLRKETVKLDNGALPRTSAISRSVTTALRAEGFQRIRLSRDKKPGVWTATMQISPKFAGATSRRVMRCIEMVLLILGHRVDRNTVYAVVFGKRVRAGFILPKH